MVHTGAAGTALRTLGNMWSNAFTEDRLIVADKIREYVQESRMPDYATLGRELPSYVQVIQTAITYVEDPDYITNRSEALLVAAKRRLLEHAGNRCLEASRGSVNPDIVLDQTFGELANIYSGGVDMATAAELSDDFINDYLEGKKNGNTLTGVPTGLPNLDASTGGLRFEQISVLAARTQHGKSALALNYIAQYAAGQLNYPVLVVGHEMPKKDYKRRMVCARAGLDYNTVFHSRLRTHTEERAFQCSKEIAKMPLTILDVPTESPSELMAHVIAWRQKVGQPGLVIIDHMQNETIPGWRGPRHEMYAQISSQWKSCMRMSGCAGLIICQLNRSAANQEPNMEHIRDSGNIEQDASAVLLLYRPGVAKKGEPANSAQIALAKNSQGPLTYDYMNFTGYSMSFRPWNSSQDTYQTIEEMKQTESHEIRQQRNDTTDIEPEDVPDAQERNIPDPDQETF